MGSQRNFYRKQAMTSCIRRKIKRHDNLIKYKKNYEKFKWQSARDNGRTIHTVKLLIVRKVPIGQVRQLEQWLQKGQNMKGVADAAKRGVLSPKMAIKRRSNTL